MTSDLEDDAVRERGRKALTVRVIKLVDLLGVRETSKLPSSRAVLLY